MWAEKSLITAVEKKNSCKIFFPDGKNLCGFSIEPAIGNDKIYIFILVRIFIGLPKSEE